MMQKTQFHACRVTLSCNKIAMRVRGILPTPHGKEWLFNPADLMDNYGLVHLNLSFCALNDQAAAALAPFLTSHPTLIHLDLSHNAICWHGARVLAEALTHGSAAPPGQAQGQRVSKTSGVETAMCSSSSSSSLQLQPRLRSLLLDGNPLGRAGVQSLMAMLMTNTSLRRLSLADVSLATRGSISQGMAGQGEAPVAFDPLHPNGTYVLDLAKSDERKVGCIRQRRVRDTAGRWHLGDTCCGRIKAPLMAQMAFQGGTWLFACSANVDGLHPRSILCSTVLTI